MELDRIKIGFCLASILHVLPSATFAAQPGAEKNIPPALIQKLDADTAVNIAGDVMADHLLSCTVSATDKKLIRNSFYTLIEGFDDAYWKATVTYEEGMAIDQFFATPLGMRLHNAFMMAIKENANVDSTTPKIGTQQIVANVYLASDNNEKQQFQTMLKDGTYDKINGIYRALTQKWDSAKLKVASDVRQGVESKETRAVKTIDTVFKRYQRSDSSCQ